MIIKNGDGDRIGNEQEAMGKIKKSRSAKTHRDFFIIEICAL
jgi:hypothetical protein